jgi:hypothetical protein
MICDDTATWHTMLLLGSAPLPNQQLLLQQKQLPATTS